VCLISVLVFGPLQASSLPSACDDRSSPAGVPARHLGVTEAPDGSHFVPEETDHAPDTNGIIIYRFGASLYFANANLFEEEVEKLVAQAATPVKWFVLDAEAMNDIDTTGAEVLHQVLTWLANRGVTVALSRANQPTSAWLARYHLLELIGKTGCTRPSSCDRGIRRETGQTSAE